MYKECLNCRKILDQQKLLKHPNLKFCNEHCRKIYQQKNYYNDYLNTGLCTSTAGALNELIVCIDLTRKGYEVFRAISPACSCDLIVINKNLKKSRIEVRQGKELDNKQVSFPKNNKADYMAILFKNDKIVYYDAKTFKEVQI